MYLFPLWKVEGSPVLLALFFSTAIIGMTAGGAVVEAKASPSPRSGTARDTVHIPFRLEGNHVFITARVKGSGPLRLLIDTGFPISLLDREQARALKLKARGGLKLAGVGGGAVDGVFLEEVTFTLPGLKFSTKAVGAAPLADWGRYSGLRVDGVIGYNFFSRYVVEIDYGASVMRVGEPGGYSYSGAGEAVPLMLAGTDPLIEAKVLVPGLAPVGGKFVIDTGSEGALHLNERFTKTNNLLSAVRGAIAGNVTGAAGGLRVLTGRVQALRVGPFEIKAPTADFSTGDTGDYAGLIGGEILRRFTVILDYPHRRMILEANSHLAEPFEEDMSGASLLAEGVDFRTFTVSGVAEGTPAAEAGLREGDVLSAIDGIPAAQFTLSQIEQMFRREGADYLLSVKRDGRVLQIRMKTRRLV